MDVDDQVDTEASAVEETDAMSEADKQLLAKIGKRIRGDRKFHEKAFKQMREDMVLARTGAVPGYSADDYRANFTGQHVRQKTASLYAKNPKIRARRRETIDFAVWDEDPASLQMAFQTITMAQQIMQQATAGAPMQVDPVSGQPQPVLPPVPPEMQQAFETAQATIADYQQGMARRQQIDRIGRTLEVLYGQHMTEQKPLDFKTGMKKVVRRACTTAVGYVKLDFQRDKGLPPSTQNGLADARSRLDHLRRLAKEAAEGEIEEDDAEMGELENAIAAMMSEPEIVIREGLVVDFPESTRVIPDRLTRSLVGFVGARHVTVEYYYTRDQVKETFGVDLGSGYKGYSVDGKTTDTSANFVSLDDEESDASAMIPSDKGAGLVCVWEHFDKTSGLVYYLADGCREWLKPPGPPNVIVEDFWPVYALTFNDVEDETQLFPPSDVYTLKSQQMAYNNARQGMVEHRYAARPRWVAAKGALDQEDVDALKTAKPFSTTLLNKPPDAALKDILETVPIPGVDPNLYETGQIFTDAQISAGTSAANLGGIAKATATESAIAANADASADQSGVDDLDSFLTRLARAGGQILMREMSEETVKRVAGVGALWPTQTLAEIAEELFLEVEAGSSGKPNQAVEIANAEKIIPLLIQIPGVKPERLAKEVVRRLDDRLDPAEFVGNGMAAIVAQNRMATLGAPQNGAPPGENDPNAQGDKGGGNGPPAPEGRGGSDPAFGSNQV